MWSRQTFVQRRRVVAFIKGILPMRLACSKRRFRRGGAAGGRGLLKTFLQLPMSLGCLSLISLRIIRTARQVLNCAPDRTRTCNLGIRRPLLYPLSYGGVLARLWPALNSVHGASRHTFPISGPTVHIKRKQRIIQTCLKEVLDVVPLWVRSALECAPEFSAHPTVALRADFQGLI